MTEGRDEKTGRPPLPHDPELMDQIFKRIGTGRSVRDVMRDEDITIGRDTFYKWLSENEVFADQYARASEERADSVFEEMFEIADDGSNDWMERKRQDGSVEEVINHEHIQRSKLRIDTRKWALARMAPKKYGDKLDLNHGGKVTVNLQGDDADL